ncbi:MAG: ABC transporter ATP-binding protein [Desulfobacteraceae bacterium]|nr:ABC transporter ATP-binding protein [Desulfobacteraceae bacterium]
MAILEVKGVTKKFGGLVAVNSVDMAIREGQIVGLIGPNGAGKTTLFNIIAGYYKPNEGKIYFQGTDITGLKPFEVCKLGIGRTFQTTRPFMENSVIDNVLVGALMHDHNVARARRVVIEIVKMLELGRLADVAGHELTVPDRKRLEVARALATGCKLLLLDEPMAGLTPTEKAHASNLLRRINDQGITLIIVEHDMKAVMMLSSYIVLLDRGNKLIEGTPGEVTKDPRAIAAYLGEEYGNTRN